MGDDTKLWCVNVWGPDDLYAMPDKATALERANSMNIEFGSIPRHEHDPIMLAVVIEWPYSPESHAEDLARYAATPSPTSSLGEAQGRKEGE